MKVTNEIEQRHTYRQTKDARRTRLPKRSSTSLVSQTYAPRCLSQTRPDARTIKKQKVRKPLQIKNFRTIFGGGEENRTPVRNHILRCFSGCSRVFRIPRMQAPHGRLMDQV